MKPAFIMTHEKFHEMSATIARLEAENARLVEALKYYANAKGDPNKGPWGVNSTDFGKVAEAALRLAGEK